MKAMGENDVVILNTVIAIIVTAIGSFISYYFSNKKAEKDALRDYKYSAKKQLYENYEPLVFQFHQLCENAYTRITDLAKNHREDRKKIFNDPTYITNTIYRIIAPLVIYRLMEQKITNFDLELDKEIKNEFLFAKALYNLLRNEEDFIRNKTYQLRAWNEPEIDPPKFPRQAVHSSDLEKMTDALLNDNSMTSDRIRIKSLTEFGDMLGLVGNTESHEESKKPLANKTEDKKRELPIKLPNSNDPFSRILDNLVNFSPDLKKVFWINLLGYAFISRAICTISKTTKNIDEKLAVENFRLPKSEIKNFFWYNPETKKLKNNLENIVQEMSSIIDQSFERARENLKSTINGPFSRH
jgi:hypothetical protein